VIAREYGFDNWANLKAHVGVLSDDPMEALTAAIQAKRRAAVAAGSGAVSCVEVKTG